MNQNDAQPTADPSSAYVHVPFCAQRCGYCNFTLVAGRDDLIDGYLRALEKELEDLQTPRPVRTLFLGGGTPTHLPPPELQQLLTLIERWFPLLPSGEYSVEANPRDVDEARTDLLLAAGVTRISLGMQSFHAAKLRLLERDHAPQVLEQIWPRVRQFASVSLDLIFGTPGESLDEWKADLREAGTFEPDHLSTYGLTYEKGTAYWSRVRRGDLTPLDEELERDMYLAAIEHGESTGLEHYEVSNFAWPGHRCRHNENYWQGGEFFGVGPGAASFLAGERRVNHRSPFTYVKRLLSGQSPVQESERLGAEDRARESLVFGLRRLEGVQLEEFARRTGHQVADLVGDMLPRFLEEKWLVLADGRLRLSRDGLLLSDALWPHFLRR